MSSFTSIAVETLVMRELHAGQSRTQRWSIAGPKALVSRWLDAGTKSEYCAGQVR